MTFSYQVTIPASRRRRRGKRPRCARRHPLPIGKSFALRSQPGDSKRWSFRPCSWAFGSRRVAPAVRRPQMLRMRQLPWRAKVARMRSPWLRPTTSMVWRSTSTTRAWRRPIRQAFSKRVTRATGAHKRPATVVVVVAADVDAAAAAVVAIAEAEVDAAGRSGGRQRGDRAETNHDRYGGGPEHVEHGGSPGCSFDFNLPKRWPDH